MKFFHRDILGVGGPNFSAWDAFCSVTRHRMGTDFESVIGLFKFSAYKMEASMRLSKLQVLSLFKLPF